MSKKGACITVLLFANLVLLAHAVVPHHHHAKTGICLLDSHCEDHSEADNHASPTSEQDETPFSEECCLLNNNVYILVHNPIKNVCRTHVNCDCEKDSYTLASNTFDIQDFVDNVGIHFRQKPYVPLFYSEYTSQSMGLRAPPVC